MVSVRGYVDRIEDGQMVIIADTLEREFIVKYHKYPNIQTADWVVMTLGRDSEVIDIEVNHKATQSRKKRLAQLKQSLKRR